ncbi:MAG: exo-alpha-sialidase [Anaerolineae bacterium]|nr:exo-alpha-sialidase [Anaerolineae bacterium]
MFTQIKVGLLVSLLAGGLLFPPVSSMQNLSPDWSDPQLIARVDGQLAVSTIALVADRAGQLHLFYPSSPDEMTADGIDYARWDGRGWSHPVNILVSASGNDLSHVQAVIDSEQFIHLIWQDGNNTLRYASALSTAADQPQAWSFSESLAGGVLGAHLISDGLGNLFVAYSDATAGGRGLTLTASADGGEQWSAPFAVASSHGFDSVIGQVRLASGGKGQLHVVWTEYKIPDGWPPLGVFYTRSSDDGAAWAAPERIADIDHGQVGIAAADDQVHLIWRSTIGGDGTFHQWSLDEGESWSAFELQDDRGGFSGLPSLVWDSRGVLHYLVGSGFAGAWTADAGTAYYVDVAGYELRRGIGQDTRWTQPERAVMEIVNGNQLHVIFETGFNRLWHTFTTVDAPAIPSEPLPTAIPTATPVATPTPEDADSTALPAYELDDATPLDASYSGADWTSVIGPGAATLLVVSIVVWRSTRRRR